MAARSFLRSKIFDAPGADQVAQLVGDRLVGGGNGRGRLNWGRRSVLGSRGRILRRLGGRLRSRLCCGIGSLVEDACGGVLLVGSDRRCSDVGLAAVSGVMAASGLGSCFGFGSSFGFDVGCGRGRHVRRLRHRDRRVDGEFGRILAGADVGPDWANAADDDTTRKVAAIALSIRSYRPVEAFSHSLTP